MDNQFENAPMPENTENVEMMRIATIYDVAELSGVSTSTVSRVINGSPKVSEKTRAKVNKVIEEIHFSPSSVARAMSSHVTKTLGVVISDITNPYFSALYLEIQRFAVEVGYSILLFNTFFGGSSHGVASSIDESTYFNTLTEKKVDGILIVGGEIDRDQVSDSYMETLNELGKRYPIVVIGEPKQPSSCSFLRRNVESGIGTLVTHLVALGRTKIGFVGGEPGVNITTLRLDSFKSALNSLMVPVKEELISLSNYYMPDGYEAMKYLLETPDTTPTAVVAINDAVAMGAIRAINDVGLRVPEDISVVSCDQFPYCEYSNPRITSLDRNDNYLGRLSIIALLNKINHGEVPSEMSVAPKLQIRESCGASQGLHFDN